MSVRAYIVREKHIWINENRGTFQYDNNGENLVRYTHTDEEFAFNITRQPNFLEELFKYGAEDYTNYDFIGEIEIGRDDFHSMIENSKIEFDEDDLESIKTIEKYLSEGNEWIVFSCY